jgi:hypothetical protein
MANNLGEHAVAIGSSPGGIDDRSCARRPFEPVMVLERDQIDSRRGA